MSKKIIGIIVGAVLVAALVVTLVLLNNTPAEEAESTVTADAIYVLQAGEDNYLQSATISNAEGSFGIVTEMPEDATTPTYMLEGYEKYDTATALNTLGRNLTTMTAKSIVSEEGDAATFGLDKPTATADITYSDGTTVTLNVGAQAPGNEGYYASTSKGGATVYLVTTSLVENTFGTALGFLSTTLTGGAADSTTVDRAELGGTVRAEPIIVEPVEEGSAEASAMTTHMITSPIHTSTDSQNGIAALQGAFGLTADAVVGVADSDAALEEYGLLKPYSTISVTPTEDAEMDTVELAASAPDADGNVYLMRGDSDLVYQMAASALPWLEIQVYDLMNKLVVLPFIDDVSRVTVATPDESYTFELGGESDELEVTCNGEPVEDVSQFRKLYQEMIGARYDGQLGDDTAEPETEAEAAEEEEETAQAAGLEDGAEEADGDTGESAVIDETEPAPEGEDAEATDGTEPGGETAANSLIPADAPLLMTYTYEYRDGRAPDVVSFYAGPTRKAYVQLNDGQPYLTPRTYVDSILPNVQRLLAGEAIEGYLH